MPRHRVYTDVDVLTAAKRRLHHIFDIFDTVVVMFSGGKDSLTVLHLTREVMLERGMDKPLDVVFRDEELIPEEVINFVDEYRRLDWIRMVWFCVPLASHKYVLGVVHSYVQWDPGRQWVRPKPEWAEVLPPGDDRVFDQYSMDAFTAQRYRGKIAFLTGIRAAESLVRFRSCVNKLNENYIVGVVDPKASNVKLCKPIFDWEENDVFRYFFDHGIKYCPLYDLQMWAGNSLRISTPLHAESAKRFDLIRSTVPDFYPRVIDVFPEMLAQYSAMAQQPCLCAELIGLKGAIAQPQLFNLGSIKRFRVSHSDWSWSSPVIRSSVEQAMQRKRGPFMLPADRHQQRMLERSGLFGT